MTLFLPLIFLFTWFSPVNAQRPIDLPDVQLPERAGIYDVPGRPNLKLRVFVHNAKPTPPPAPICNDPLDGPDVRPAGWYLPISPWGYYLNIESVPLSVGSDKLSKIAGDAFSPWSNAINNKVTFSEVDTTLLNKAQLDGKNIISWGRAPGSALAVTYIWYDRTNGKAAELDTIMNQRFSWSWTDPSVYSPTNYCSQYPKTYDAQDILTHELGHWVGLNDEYDPSFKENTMYGYGVKGEIKKDTLTTGDVNGVSSIY